MLFEISIDPLRSIIYHLELFVKMKLIATQAQHGVQSCFQLKKFYEILNLEM